MKIFAHSTILVVHKLSVQHLCCHDNQKIMFASPLPP